MSRIEIAKRIQEIKSFAQGLIDDSYEGYLADSEDHEYIVNKCNRILDDLDGTHGK